jgi:uncharacterized protein
MEPASLAAIALFVVVSFAYANVGLGGGLLYFPILYHLFPDWTPSTIVALTLLCSIATQIASATTHHRAGLVHGRTVLLLAVPLALGAAVGARITIGAATEWMRIGFAIVLIGVAARMAWKSWKKGGPPAASAWGRGVRLSLLALAAAATGVLSGCVGIGGGVVLVPLLLALARLDMRPAIGTASAALAVTATVGFTTYLLSRQVHAPVGLAACLALAALVGGAGGARWGLRHLKTPQVRWMFISALVLAAVSVVVR